MLKYMLEKRRHLTGVWVIRPSAHDPHKSLNKLNLLLAKVQSL